MKGKKQREGQKKIKTFFHYSILLFSASSSLSQILYQRTGPIKPARLFLTTAGDVRRTTPEAAPGNLFTSGKLAFSACCIEIDIPFHKIMQTKEHGIPGGKPPCPGRCGDNVGPEDFENDNNVEPVFPPASDLSFF